MADPTHVLVVDDDDDVRETLGLLLGLEGFQITSAANGREALDLILGGAFGAEHPRVVLLDLRMPLVSGWQVIDALGDADRLDDLPILVCTSSPEEAPEGFPVLEKPVDLDELFLKLRATAA